MSKKANTQPVRGTHDVLENEFKIFQFIQNLSRQIGSKYGFKEISLPIFEFTDVFSRSLGETSDVVNKEMFTFETRGGDSITLRPEFTASIARAFISNGLEQNLPLKYFTTGPLFRYERPQKGRQRQFHQVNFEHIGEEGPYVDAEMVILGYDILANLGLTTKCRLDINSIGDAESRIRYTTALVEALTPHKNELSEDSQRRLTNNPLRILDTKDKGDKQILIDHAPRIMDYYSDAAKEYFETFMRAIEPVSAQMEVRLNPGLVRGLDYYNHTVFEFIATEGVGSQSAILSGGRYDGLVAQLGGKPTPAVGFAAGIERLMLLVDDAKVPNPVSPIALFSKGYNGDQEHMLIIAFMLRQEGYPVEIIRSGKYDKKFKKAEKMNANYAIILDENVKDTDEILVKNLNQKDDGTRLKFIDRDAGRLNPELINLIS